MIATTKLLDVFVEVADTLVADYDVIEFLHGLAEHVAQVSQSDAVGLLLADHLGQLHFTAASTDGARHMELFQEQNEEGPCHDCYLTGEPVIIDDLASAANRWPRFVPAAAGEGFRSVHAFPMRLRDRVIGALNVFSLHPLPLGMTEVRTIQALADVATIAILQQQSLAAAETLTEQLQSALNSRVVIEQAKGVLAQSNRISVDEAFEVMRRYARNRGLRLGVVAHDVVQREIDPTGLGGPAPS